MQELVHNTNFIAIFSAFRASFNNATTLINDISISRNVNIAGFIPLWTVVYAIIYSLFRF